MCAAWPEVHKQVKEELALPREPDSVLESCHAPLISGELVVM
jgi:hypothetical protein